MSEAGSRGVRYPAEEYSVHPIPSREKKKAGKWDGHWAKSAQGICIAVCIFCSFIAWVIIASTPYMRTFYVQDGQTWPFHLVMFLTIVSWLLFICCYAYFASSQPHKRRRTPWKLREMQFNITMTVLVFLAFIIEATNVWRWDFSQGFTMDPALMMGGMGGSMAYRPRNGQLNPRMMQNMLGPNSGRNMAFAAGSGAQNNFCAQYPQDCSNLVSLMAGINPFFGHHVFAAIMLAILFIVTVVALVFSVLAYRKWREEYLAATSPPPSVYSASTRRSEQSPGFFDGLLAWFGNLKTTITERGAEAKDSLMKVVKRDGGAADENDVDIGDPEDKYGFNAAKPTDEKDLLANGDAGSIHSVIDDLPPPDYPESASKSRRSSKSNYSKSRESNYSKSRESERSRRGDSKPRDYDDSRSHRSSRSRRHDEDDRRSSRHYDDDRRSSKHDDDDRKSRRSTKSRAESEHTTKSDHRSSSRHSDRGSRSSSRHNDRRRSRGDRRSRDRDDRRRSSHSKDGSKDDTVVSVATSDKNSGGAGGDPQSPSMLV